MNEFKAIVEGLSRAGRTRQRVVLATVVGVTGSAYRRPGARMLVFPSGESIGTVSGGCLEQDVVTRACNMLKENARHFLVSYDTTRDDEIIFGTGTGCEGMVKIFLQSVEPEEASSTAESLVNCLLLKRPFVLGTVIAAGGASQNQTGQIILVERDRVHKSNIAHRSWIELVSETARQALTFQSASLAKHNLDDGAVEIFYDIIKPPISLCIFGGGYDSIPVATLAAQLGWSVTVVDERPAFARLDRFPGALEVLCTGSEELAASNHPLTWNAVIVMNHNFRKDLAALSLGLKSDAEYIGVLGPKKRTARLLDLCLKETELSARELERVHAPVGLDIGAQTPAEIALAALGEIIAKRNNSAAGFLKNKNGPIHARQEMIASEDDEEESTSLPQARAVLTCRQ